MLGRFIPRCGGLDALRYNGVVSVQKAKGLGEKLELVLDDVNPWCGPGSVG